MSAIESSATVGVQPQPLRRRAVDLGVPVPESSVDRLSGAPEVAHRDRIFRRSLVAADGVAAACVLAALGLAGHLTLRPSALVALPAVVLLAKLLGLYDREELLLRKSTLEETPHLVELSTFVVVLAWFGQEALATEPLTRPAGALLWVELCLFMLAARAAARMWSRAVAPAERLLLVGDETQHGPFAEKLDADQYTRAPLVAPLPLNERRAVHAE